MDPTLTKYVDDIQNMYGDARPGEVIDLPDSASYRKKIRIAVVGPAGQFSVVQVGPGYNGSTAGVVFWSEEEQRPKVNIKMQGEAPDGFPQWITYHDLCKRTGEMRYYDRWKKWDDIQVRRKAAGLAPKEPARRWPKGMEPPPLAPGQRPHRPPCPPPDDWYHPVVLARREKSSDGAITVDMMKEIGVDYDGAGNIHVTFEAEDAALAEMMGEDA